MCMCVSKQRKNITCGKKDQFLRWVKKNDTQILFDWAFDVDRFGMCYRSTFRYIGWK